jgi:hypothetical protein
MLYSIQNSWVSGLFHHLDFWTLENKTFRKLGLFPKRHSF